MRFRKIIRMHDWWISKMAPVLAVGYATVAMNNGSLFKSITGILIVLSSLIVGAIYVSIINDVTDIAIDNQAGKYNYMARLPASFRIMIPLCCVLGGIAFMCFFYPDIPSLLWYGLSWIAFSLYSFPPVRLKERGILGVLADAGGAHLFPTCLMVAAVSYFMHWKVEFYWFMIVAVWALALGLRGILWHQFRDRNNDLLTGVNTYATSINPQQFKYWQRVILVFEVLALFIILLMLHYWMVGTGLLLYLVWSLLQYKLSGRKPVIIQSVYNSNTLLVMTTYYQVFFPLSLLIKFAIDQPAGWWVLMLHLLLFSRYLLETFRPVFNINNYRRLWRLRRQVVKAGDVI
ncbi:4-hydroxybenzoate polyprenyltransferase [Chitinophaga polysaccharea]|uniref:4-hydroxybenzoate polyprenyltransferase n=1 Tax=Chitinophaga polysaccharea TaxID=1293035 RepID=A0A561Q4H6_9BACT|nr:UbiA family prenyltransferase [Chitinophaga polysaccharea]TWF45273.1 4-hydroxybenzoate polyprenyltransferase [Chitinophaga polysaccharea]